MKTATLTASFQIELLSIDEGNPFFDYLEDHAGKDRCIAEVIDGYVEPPSEEIRALISYTMDYINNRLTEGDLSVPFRVFVNAVDKGSVH